MTDSAPLDRITTAIDTEAARLAREDNAAAQLVALFKAVQSLCEQRLRTAYAMGGPHGRAPRSA